MGTDRFGRPVATRVFCRPVGGPPVRPYATTQTPDREGAHRNSLSFDTLPLIVSPFSSVPFQQLSRALEGYC